MAGTYRRRKLIDIEEEKIEMTQFDKDSQTVKTNKLDGIIEVVFSLDKLVNTNNLENGSPCITLLTYHMAAYGDSFHFEPHTAQYKKLKNGEFVSLTLRIKHMKNNTVVDGPVTTVMLHIR